MRELLGSFIRSFHKAIRGEMDAMRERLGPFEVPLKGGRRADASAEGDHVYLFDIIAPNDKLALHMECTLRCEASESVVTVTGLDGGTLTVRSGHRIPLELATYTLVIYPWFLYERLSQALEGLVDGDEAAMARTFTAFGKIEPVKTPTPTRLSHPGLNESQLRAVGLCCSSNLAFVWGPPGTGKTTTLGHIVTELVAHGHRVLVTSTTNAAVDQALEKLAGLEEAQGTLERGEIVRVGHAHGDTFGAGLREVVNRVHRDAHERLDELKSRLMAASGRARQCAQFQSKLEDAAEPLQGDLFEESHAIVPGDWELRAVFDEADLPRLRAFPPDQLLGAVRREGERLEGEKAACQAGIRETSQALSDREPEIVRKARVVLATMTNVYISPLLSAERFDVVIVEEAGMAILPTLFYCATLADAKAIMVGDPKQLPPIVQSRAPYVHQVMGRSIFEVTVPRPHASDVVEMLDTQYRMHPAIGDLVSGLFYDGKLINGPNTADHEQIAQREPFAGAALVVIDTQGRTQCAKREGAFSRFNETTAQACVDWAARAVRGGVTSVAIITPYAEQSRLIRRLLSKARVPSDAVECRTVHRFQGNERDVVILDTVDTVPLPPGVLLAGDRPGSTAINLLNVSISRARGKLIIVADVDYFARRAPKSVLNAILKQAAARGCCATLEGEH